MLDVGILFIILFFLPVGLEIFVEALGKGKERTLAYLWTRGLLWEWGTFAVVYIVLQIVSDYRFRIHWITSLILCTVLSTVGIIICFLKKRKIFTLRLFGEKRKPMEICLKAVLILFVIFLCWKNINQSAFLSDDITIETMNTIMQNDTVGKVDPYTGLAYTEGQNVYREPALVVFWAGLAWCLGIHPAALLNLYLAPFFMLLFYVFCLEAGRQLFGQDGIKAELFVYGVAVLHVFGAARNWLPFYQLENGPWIPEHILSFFLLPMLALELFKGLQLKKKKEQICRCAAVGIMTAFLANTGWFYVLVMYVLAGIVYLGRKLWKC